MLLAVAVAFAFVFAHVAMAASPSPSPAARPTSEEPALVALGRRLFFDPTLSEPAGTSCASCHDPARAFSGNHGSTNGVARGSRPGHFARRNTPSVLYLAYVPRFHTYQEEDAPQPSPFGGFFWDGRADSIAALVMQPLTNPDEMNNHDARAIAAKLRAGYANDFRRALGIALDDPDRAAAALGKALEAFLTSPAMAPFSSKYDAYVRGRAVLTPDEARGLALFKDPDKGNCASCHLLTVTSPRPERSMFTDYGYDAVAVPRNHRLRATRRADAFDLGLCERGRAGVARTTAAALTATATTTATTGTTTVNSGTAVAASTTTTGATAPVAPAGDEKWCASFRTPSLRNVAVREAFMHNGAFTSLRDVVAFYATRATDPMRWYKSKVKFDDVPPRFRGQVNINSIPYNRRAGDTPALDDRDIDAIVAFLRTLTDAAFQ